MIRILPDQVINQIAAGEVIERPAAVVRELVDNSLDAGATDIQIMLVEGGHNLIAVYDNGAGMPQRDLVLAFERHATSKIAAIDDLNVVESRGFRGEALAAIASVGRVAARSRSASEPLGNELVIEGGKLLGVKPVACPLGTQVEVRGLFFNTPARKKFLRTARVEEARVCDWLAHACLGAHAVHFRLIADGNERLNLSADASLLDRAGRIFSGTALNLDFTADLISVKGLLLHPQHAEAGSHGLAILVNGRLVSDRMVMRAVKDGFGAILKDREFPRGVVAIDLPVRYVDVNVHPQKSEVRFRAPQAVFACVRKAVEEALGGMQRPVWAHNSAAAAQAIDFSNHSSWRPAETLEMKPQAGTPPAGFQQLNRAASDLSQPHSQPETYPFAFSELRYLGQALGCYLVNQWQECLVLVDMHAAHERCNYNRVMQRFGAGPASAQQLLAPERLHLTQSQFEDLREDLGIFEDAGFSIDLSLAQANQSSNACFALISAIPSLLTIDSAALVVREHLECRTPGSSQLSSLERARQRIAARIACHASVRSGKLLDTKEVQALYADLDSAISAGACPHGRPVAVCLDRRELEVLFGRSE